jgi:hypothetical protein
MMVGSELGLLPANAIYGGQLFMPRDFPETFGPSRGDKGSELPLKIGLIIEEVENMALGLEVEECKRQRNRALLASWNALPREKDELRTMTWAGFGFRYNIEPFRTEAVRTWVTLLGAAADESLNDEQMDMSRALDSMEVWRNEGMKELPKFIQNRNFKGLDSLRITYGDSQRMAEKAEPDGTVKIRAELPTSTTFWANHKTAPKKDEGQKRPPQTLATEESSGEDSEEKAERKRQRKKGAQGEAINPNPFLSLGRTVSGPGEEYGKEENVLLPDVFGDMMNKGKKSSKPSLPLPKELAPKEGKKENQAPKEKARGSPVVGRRTTLNEAATKVETEKSSWADLVDDELGLNAPAKRLALELLEEKGDTRRGEGAADNGGGRAGSWGAIGRKEATRVGKRTVEALGVELKGTSLRGEKLSLNSGKEKETKEAPDSAMQMALQIPHPLIQATNGPNFKCSQKGRSKAERFVERGYRRRINKRGGDAGKGKRRADKQGGQTSKRI